MRNQFDNSINSNQPDPGRWASAIVWAITLVVAALVGASALAMPAPLAGRLHPGHAPAALALLCLTAGVMAALSRTSRSPDPDCLPTPAPSPRAIILASAAVIVLALGTRVAGVLPAVFVAATLAALGVAGVSLLRAALTGAALAALAALLFVLALRQPLPLLPGVW